MKKVLSLLLVAVMILCFAACGGNTETTPETGNIESNAKEDIKVGFIFLHDENSTYDKNFMDAAYAAKDALGNVMDQVVTVKEVKLLATSVQGVDMNGLRELGDQLKDKLGEGVVVLASEVDGKVNLMAMATDAALAKGAHAGNLIKGIAALVGGGGGGRPNMAQAGGKNPAGIKDAIAKVAEVLESQLG